MGVPNWRVIHAKGHLGANRQVWMQDTDRQRSPALARRRAVRFAVADAIHSGPVSEKAGSSQVATSIHRGPDGRRLQRLGCRSRGSGMRRAQAFGLGGGAEGRIESHRRSRNRTSSGRRSGTGVAAFRLGSKGGCRRMHLAPVLIKLPSIWHAYHATVGQRGEGLP